MTDLDGRLAGLFKALGHPTRVAIVDLLRSGERCVCDIWPELGVEQSALSKHLAILRREGLLVSRKEGLRVIYAPRCDRIAAIMDLAHELLKERWQEEQRQWSKHAPRGATKGGLKT